MEVRVHLSMLLTVDLHRDEAAEGRGHACVREALVMHAVAVVAGRKADGDKAQLVPVGSERAIPRLPRNVVVRAGAQVAGGRCGQRVRVV